MTHSLITIKSFNSQLLLSFPFEAKDAFKAVFKTAKWSAADRAWVVADTTANKNKFNAFVESISALLDELQAAQSAEATAEQLAAAEAEVTKAIAAAKARTAAAQETIARLAPVVEAKRAELAALSAQKEAALAEEADAAAAIEEILEQHDVAEALAALRTFTRSYTKQTRAAAEAAQETLIAAYREVKKTTELKISTLFELANISLNRADKISKEIAGVTVASLAREAE